jgi:hypothetical protein
MRMAYAAALSSIATTTSQDPLRILAFIPARNCVSQTPRVIVQFTPDIQGLFACAEAAA